MYEAVVQELLNRKPAVDVCMFEIAAFQLGNDLSRLARHLLNDPAFYHREIKRPVAQHDHVFLTVEPFVEPEHNVEGLTSDHDHVDAPIKLGKSVRHLFAAAQEVEPIVGPRKKT